MSWLCSLSTVLNHLRWNMCPSRYWGKWLWAIPVMGWYSSLGKFLVQHSGQKICVLHEKMLPTPSIDATSPEQFCNSVMSSEITYWSPLLGTYFLYFDLFCLPVGLLLFFGDLIDLIFCRLLSQLCLFCFHIQSTCSAFISGLGESDPRGSSLQPLLLLAYFRLPASYN